MYWTSWPKIEKMDGDISRKKVLMEADVVRDIKQNQIQLMDHAHPLPTLRYMNATDQGKKAAVGSCRAVK